MEPTKQQVIELWGQFGAPFDCHRLRAPLGARGSHEVSGAGLASGKWPHNYGESRFLLGKPTVNGHFEWKTVSSPEGV